jgi:hypothetical protein
MEVVCSSETLVSTYKSKQHYYQDDQHRCLPQIFIKCNFNKHSLPSSAEVKIE